MGNHISYTTEEIAKLLKVSKLTVYDLIKKGELPSYRVGKQMRIDETDLEAYKWRTKNGQASGHAVSSAGASVAIRPLVITGQDVGLDILANHLEKTTMAIRPLRSYAGSLDGLISLYQGKSDIVSTHLLDGDSGEYNLPYIQKLMVGFSYIVIRLLSRWAGIFVQKGNPKQIHSWKDLSKQGVRVVNRERGSGARVLLDEQLRLHGISAAHIIGYRKEESNHLSVAGKVAANEADAGIGIEKAAYVVGIDFVPLIQEKYDLVMLKSAENLEWIAALKEILRSETFKKELTSIRGYDLSSIGETVFETE